MRKFVILTVILLLSCVTTTRNPFETGNRVGSPQLIIRNNYWNVRFIKVFCDDSQLQIIRGITFNNTERKEIRFCSTSYRFSVNDQWVSNPLIWEGRNINLVIEPNIALSYVY